MLFFQLMACYVSVFGTPAQAPVKSSLTVDVHNIRELTGNISVAIFKPCEKFPDCKPVEGKRIDVKKNRIQVSFDVDPGEYAVAVYHDVNDNGKLDKKLFGIPKEPYGFSNNYRPVVSAPSFKDCQVSVGTGETSVSIKLL
nr:DUF2141 domain-containing protein [uncultured Arsenicibacter sp.]